MARRNRRRRWTWFETLVLRYLAWRGRSAFVIGERLGRTSDGVLAKAHELGVAVRRHG